MYCPGNLRVGSEAEYGVDQDNYIQSGTSYGVRTDSIWQSQGGFRVRFSTSEPTIGVLITHIQVKSTFTPTHPMEMFSVFWITNNDLFARTLLSF